MYIFEYELNDKLPKLAWLASINKFNKIVKVLHGKNVECKETYFVAGVWDDEFDTPSFDKTDVFWGTGAKITNDEIRFVTPSHSLERLLIYSDDEEIVVSNSFPFFIAYKDFSLDNKENQYEKIMCSMIYGREKIIKKIPLKNEKGVEQIIVGSIVVDKNMGIEYVKRPDIRPFKSYDDYYGRMRVSLKKIKENAVSQLRQHIKYELVSTISSGYDSPACSAMAKEIGCDTAITLTNGKYVNDSGELIARQLGYKNIIKRDCFLYKKKKGLIDAEYISSGEQGTQLQFCVFEDVLEDKIAFFGVRGCYWNKKDGTTNDFEMDDHYFCEADVSWTENALKNGYIVAPLPTYGASICTSIREISNSMEMRPWVLGTHYDKPIPRRILETAGVSREAFGMHKYGGGFCLSYETKWSIGRKMSKEGYENFQNYLKETQYERRNFLRMYNKIRYLIKTYPIYFNVVSAKLGSKIRLKSKPANVSNPGVPLDLFFWSVMVMKNRYLEAIQNKKM